MIKIASVHLWVHDQEVALKYWTEKVGMEVRQDVSLPDVEGLFRWLTVGPVVFQPSELAKIAIAVWAAAYLTQRRPPATMKELARPLGVVFAAFAVLIMMEPDLGTTITLMLMLVGVLLVAGAPIRLIATSTLLVSAVGLAAIWV